MRTLHWRLSKKHLKLTKPTSERAFGAGFSCSATGKHTRELRIDGTGIIRTNIGVIGTIIGTGTIGAACFANAGYGTTASPNFSG